MFRFRTDMLNHASVNPVHRYGNGLTLLYPFHS